MINNVFVGDAIALLRHDSDPTEAALRDEIAAREPWLSVLNVEWVAKEVLRQGPVKAADDAEREKVRRTANAALAITIVRELANKAYDLDESRLATLVGGRDTTLSPAKKLGAVKACLRWSHAQIDGWWEKAE